MSTLFALPVPQVLEASGLPMMGASLYFYESGTSTPKAVYADAALSTEASNPLVSDIAGRFEATWLDCSDGPYTVKLFDATGTLVWSVDGIDGYGDWSVQPLIDLAVNDFVDPLAADLASLQSDVEGYAVDILANTNAILNETLLRTSEDDNLQSQINTLLQATSGFVYVQSDKPLPGVGDIPDPIVNNARWYDDDDNNHPYLWHEVSLVNATYQWTATGNPGEYYVALSGGLNPGLLQPDAMYADSTQLTLGTLPLSAGQYRWGNGGGGFNTVIVRLTDSADPDSKAADFVVHTAWYDLEDPRIGQNEAAVTALEARMTTAEGDIDANATAISVTDATVSSIGSTVSTHSSQISVLQSDLTTAEGNISANSTAVSTLDSRVTTAEGDITTNANDITTLESTVNNPTTGVSANAAAIDILETTVNDSSNGVAANASKLSYLGAMNGGGTAFVINGSTAWVDASTSMATKFSTIEASIGGNTANISTINTVTVPGINSNISSLDSAVSTINNTTIPGINSDVTALEARYGVSLNVNGHVTGFLQNNDGSSGSMIIQVDKFAVVDPGGGSVKVPFSIVGGVCYMQNVVIQNAQIANLSVGKLITGTFPNGEQFGLNGDFNVGTTGRVRGGKTGFGNGNGTGFYLGYYSGAYVLDVGSDSEYVRYASGQLVVKGRIQPRSLVAAAHGAFTVSGGTASWDTSGAERYPSTMTVTRAATGQYTIGWSSGWANPGYSVVVTANGKIATVGSKSTTGFIIYTYAYELYYLDPPTNSQPAVHTVASEAVNVSFVVFKADPTNPSGPPSA